MTRARRRQQRQHTADAEWLRRREAVLAGHPGDHLLEATEFWASEPDVPADLRRDPYRWRDVLAPPDVAEQTRAKRTDLLERRMVWLEANGQP